MLTFEDDVEGTAPVALSLSGRCKHCVCCVTNLHLLTPCVNPAQMQWLVFDGAVDASWMENINPMFEEDGGTLQFLNGESLDMRILGNRLKIIFETDDLSGASPSTISRLGIVHVGAEPMSWQARLQAWMQQRVAGSTDVRTLYTDPRLEELAEHTRATIERFLPIVLDISEAVAQDSPALVDHRPERVMDFLDLLHRPLCNSTVASVGTGPRGVGGEESNEEDDEGKTIDTWKSMVDALLVFSAAWVFGAPLSAEGKLRFDERLRSGVLEPLRVSLPCECLVYDFYVDGSSGACRLWADGQIPELTPAALSGYLGQPNPTMAISTPRDASYAFAAASFMKLGRPVFISGGKCARCFLAEGKT